MMIHLLTCDISVYLHETSKEWELFARVTTPDCCCVVLLPMAPIPTYRQSPANRLCIFNFSKTKLCVNNFLGVPLPSPTTVVGWRCHWRRYNHLQPPKPNLPFRFFLRHLYTMSPSYINNRQPCSITIHYIIKLPPIFLEHKSCKINHFGLFLY